MQRMQTSVPRRTGFTLIELLVVVSIIAMLIAILLPSLKKAQAAAIKVKCASQLHQIALATDMYAGQNQGYRPSRGPNDASIRPHTMVWQTYDLNKTFIVPYLRDRDKMMFCPSTLMAIRNPKSPSYDSMFVTYAYNAYADTSAWRLEPIDLTRVVAYKGRASLWNCLTIHDVGGLWYMAHDRPVAAEAPEGLNTAFTDGSAGWVNYNAHVTTDAYWQSGTQYYVWALPNIN